MSKETHKCPLPLWAPGARFKDFTIERVEKLPELRTTVYVARHEKTGAKIIDLHCQDRENVFAIAFLTPPSRSDGLPHILEHSVLAGSINYPVKDAFNELIRGSLQTFLNAFTYPDRTVYPVASQVRVDFYHLARVYYDLVFRPLLRKETFAQEGHHLEFAVPDDAASDLVFSGVVFNEMKGAYSSPDNLMYKAVQENLFPDTVYRFDSGGEPEEIVKLSYEEFLAFHRKHYSPSNAFFFFYGQFSPEENLCFLQELLAGLEGETVDLAVPRQPRWEKPRMVKRPFPILKEEDPAKKGVVNVAWLLTENTDVFETLILQIVSGILVGTAAGPLRKALIDSRLGEDLSPITGLETDLREAFFVVGLRGTDPAKATAIENLVLETLKNTIRGGIDRELIEAVLHQVEFSGKEIVRSVYPYGLKLMGRVFQTWPYGGDPVSAINFPALIEEVRRRWAEDAQLFEKAIDRWWLSNPHRLLCVMEPSSSYLEERERKMEEIVAEKRRSMKERDLTRVLEEAKKLKEYQVTPDPPEAVGTLPRLTRRDLETKVEIVPTEVTEQAGLTILKHDLFTNGIAYVDLAFDLSHVPEEMIPYLPLLGKLMVGLGAKGLSYEEMAKRIALNTGGISVYPSCGLTLGHRDRVWERMMVRMRVLYRKIDEAIDTLCDLLTSCDFSDLKRVEDLILESKNRLISAVIPSGHLFAKMMAASSFSLPAWREEQWGGRSQLVFVSRALESFRGDRESFVKKVTELKESVFRRSGLIINLTAEEEGLNRLTEKLPVLFECLGDVPPPGERIYHLPPAGHRGVIVPAEVAYVAGALEAPIYGAQEVPAMMVGSKYLSSGFLYKTIRVQGGAYGGSCLYDPSSGVFSFLSYRDPHIVRTLNAYLEAGRLISREKPGEEEVEKAIISAIGALDRPLDPAGKGYVSLTRFLSGINDAYRQALRDAMVELSADTMWRGVREFFENMDGKMVVAVLSNEDKLQAANSELSNKLIIEALLE